MLDIKHVTICYSLYDFYNILAKVPHGVYKKWEHNDRLDKMKKSLTELKNGTYEGQMKKTEPFIKGGIFLSGMPIITETKKSLGSETEVSNEKMIDKHNAELRQTA